MYERTLALNNNPFDPKLPDMGVSDLAGNPLLVDKYPELERLFCWELGDLRESDDAAAEVLFGAPPAEPVAVAQEAIIVIRGGRATGKTTFASHLKRRILASPAPGSGAWQVFEEKEDAPDLRVFRDQLDGLGEGIKNKFGGNRASLLVVLENIPELGFDSVVQLYLSFDKYFRVFIVTTTDMTLTQYNLDWYQPRIELIETRNVTLADVGAYAEYRVRLFRNSTRKEIDQISILFPFGSNALGRLLGSKEEPIRVMNRRLSREVANHHKRLITKEPDLDVADAPPEKLSSLLID